MYIAKLSIKNYGNIAFETILFEEQTTIVTADFCDEIVSALKMILGYNSKSPYLRKTSSIKAECVADSLIRVEYSGGTLKALNENNEAITEYYLNLISHNTEEDSLNVFNHFKKQKYPHRLLKYKDVDKYYGMHDFGNITHGYGTTRSFRAFLNDYIKNFEPIRINKDKEYFIQLLPSGEFIVKYGYVSITPHLSESELVLYHYICFLCLADFWSHAESIRNINRIDKPIIVSDFLERIDDSINLSDIMERTLQLERQVIIITPNKTQEVTKHEE